MPSYVITARLLSFQSLLNRGMEGGFVRRHCFAGFARAKGCWCVECASLQVVALRTVSIGSYLIVAPKSKLLQIVA